MRGRGAWFGMERGERVDAIIPAPERKGGRSGSRVVIQVRRITMSDALYAQECALRESVLLKPIGFDMARFRREFPYEEAFEHFVAVFAHPSGPRVVGCATLLVNHPEAGVGKLMQMAVDPQRQGEGIGKKIVAEIERRAFGDLGLKKLYCHARDNAFGFYASLGWTFASDVFMEAGLPHKTMEFQPPVVEE